MGELMQEESNNSKVQISSKKLSFAYYFFLYVGLSFSIAGIYPYINLLFSDGGLTMADFNLVDGLILVSAILSLWGAYIVYHRQSNLRVLAAIFSILVSIFNPMLIIFILSRTMGINIFFEFNTGMIMYSIIIPLGIVNSIILFINKDFN